MRLPVTLIKGEHVSSRTDYRDNLPVNMYAVEKPILGAQGYMLQYPGLTQIGTGFGADRGGIYNERFNQHYRVSGTKFVSVATDGTVTELGDVPGSGQARLQDLYGFNTQAIVANGRMFLYDPVAGFREVTDLDLGNPIDGVWIDNYYFLTDGEYLYHTDLNDESAIDPLKFATAEFMADPSLAVVKTSDNKVMVFGRYSIEYLSDDATANFSFTRIETRAQKLGIVATHAKTEVKDTFYILGGSRNDSISVHQVASGASKKVSTREIDRIIEQYAEGDLVDVRMESRSEKNTTFILVHLPRETLLYNETIAQKLGPEYAWSILKTDIQSSSPYRGINGVFDARVGAWIYGDIRDGTIGLLDERVMTHYDNKVEWLLYSPFLGLDGASIDQLEIQTIPGHNIEDDATVALSLTSDGVSYGTEYWMQYGEPNDYGHRFIARRLGYVRDYVGFKFRGVSESRMAFALMNVEYN